MKYLLEKMLENKEVTTPDVVARSNVIVEGKFEFWEYSMSIYNFSLF